MTPGKRVLIGEQPNERAVGIADALQNNRFSTNRAEDTGELLNLLEAQRHDVIVVDSDLLDNEPRGLAPLCQKAPYTPIVVLVPHDSVDEAVNWMRHGAASCLTHQPLSGDLIHAIEAVLNDFASEAGDDEPLDHFGLTGESPAIHNVLKKLERVGQVDSTVLILGESGTGKEVLARAIHKASERRDRHFGAINCGAIPENLLESELFGHRKGAFTDARADKPGVFQECHQGTLLLDEIGDMPASLQAKLLRVLQEQEITPVGAARTVPIDTRIIAATHRDLAEEVRSGSFREDLFYRLSVVVIEMPALRDRREDIPLLVEHFLRRLNARFGKDIPMPDSQTMARMRAYDWPGNIRELKNALERAVVLAQGGRLELEHLFEDGTTHAVGAASEAHHTAEFDDTLSMPLTEAKQAFERAYLEHQLTRCNGNISEVARLSGRYRADIYRLMERYGLQQQAYRQA